MALFDKLKEKVNKVVDVEKLSEMANKTIASVKSEVAKAVDPSFKEQERLERAKSLQEQKEKAINDFFSSIDLNKEFDYIFSVLEKSGASASNFEKGVEHLLSKTEITITKADVLPALKKELFARAFATTQPTISLAIAIDYFMRDVIEGQLLTEYMSFAICKEKGYPVRDSFVKSFYGVAGHAMNFLNNRMELTNYQVMTPDAFLPIIEDSDALKSYTDKDPFAAHEVRNKWAEALCDQPFEIVHSSSLRDLLDKEEYVDAMCYWAYVAMCPDQEDCIKNISVGKIASAYINFLEDYYNRIES